MRIIVSRDMPPPVLKNLENYGEIIPFYSEGITYDAVSCHPDLFMADTGKEWILAPNIPQRYAKIFEQCGTPFCYGGLPVGNRYPESARYCAVISHNIMVANPDVVDASLIKPKFQLFSVRQGYTRCNLLVLPGNRFITSDRGIEKALLNSRFSVFYVNPDAVELPGFNNGFIGGACGVYDNQLFLTGATKYLSNEEGFREYVAASGVELIELSGERPFDSGGIFFLS